MNRLLMAILALGLVLFAADLQAGEHRIGGGANYWIAVDDLDEEGIDDDDGFSYFVSYQHWWDFLGVEVDMELLPDRFGDNAYAPEAYILIGSTIYAGAGMGLIRTNGEFADDPFYAFRVGLNLELLPRVIVDISANYRFNDSVQLEDDDTDIDADTIFLGAAIRFAL
jgi:hypothetical protein